MKELVAARRALFNELGRNVAELLLVLDRQSFPDY